MVGDTSNAQAKPGDSRKKKLPRGNPSQAVKELQQLFHWTIWIGIVVGCALFFVAYYVLKEDGAIREIVSSLAAVIVSASAVGLLLNAVWWRSWAIKAMVEIFSNRELVERLNLSEDELRLRFHAMVGAVYGANILSTQFRSTCDRDLFERLGYPLRKGLELSYDLTSEEFDGCYGRGHVARMDRVVSYTLHNYSKMIVEPFANGLVLSGFVDLPEAVRDEWQAICRAEGLSTIDDQARDSLKDLNESIKIFEFRDLSINGTPLNEGSDYEASLLFDGAKREPDIVYRVVLNEDARQRFQIESDGEMTIVYAFSTLTNRFAYTFTMMSQPTEGASFHFSWEEDIFEGVLRFILPPYWTTRQRELRKVGDRQTILFVNAMMLPGHAVLVSWRPDNARQALGAWEPHPQAAATGHSMESDETSQENTASDHPAPPKNESSDRE